MKSKLISDDGQRTYVLIFDVGDEAMEGLRAFAKEHDLTAAQFHYWWLVAEMALAGRPDK